MNSQNYLPNSMNSPYYLANSMNFFSVVLTVFAVPKRGLAATVDWVGSADLRRAQRAVSAMTTGEARYAAEPQAQGLHVR